VQSKFLQSEFRDWFGRLEKEQTFPQDARDWLPEKLKPFWLLAQDTVVKDFNFVPGRKSPWKFLKEQISMRT
jgi:hypothetical protein